MAEIKTVLSEERIIDLAYRGKMDDHRAELPDKVIDFARAIEAAVLSANAGKVDAVQVRNDALEEISCVLLSERGYTENAKREFAAYIRALKSSPVAAMPPEGE